MVRARPPPVAIPQLSAQHAVTPNHGQHPETTSQTPRNFPTPPHDDGPPSARRKQAETGTQPESGKKAKFLDNSDSHWPSLPCTNPPPPPVDANASRLAALELQMSQILNLMQHQLTLQGSPAPIDPPPPPVPVFEVPDASSMAVDTQVADEGLQTDLHYAYCAPDHLPTWLSHDRPTVRLLRTEWQQAQ
eukprot:5459788-Amphidinium_carterae.1